MIPNIDTNSISNLRAAFPALLHTLLTGYSTGGKKGLRKTDKFPMWFGLLHYGKPISNLPVFQSLPLTFSLLLSQKNPKILLKAKHLAVWTNIQNDPQH